MSPGYGLGAVRWPGPILPEGAGEVKTEDRPAQGSAAPGGASDPEILWSGAAEIVRHASAIGHETPSCRPLSFPGEGELTKPHRAPSSPVTREEARAEAKHTVG